MDGEWRALNAEIVEVRDKSIAVIVGGKRVFLPRSQVRCSEDLDKIDVPAYTDLEVAEFIAADRFGATKSRVDTTNINMRGVAAALRRKRESAKRR